MRAHSAASVAREFSASMCAATRSLSVSVRPAALDASMSLGHHRIGIDLRRLIWPACSVEMPSARPKFAGPPNSPKMVSIDLMPRTIRYVAPSVKTHCIAPSAIKPEPGFIRSAGIMDEPNERLQQARTAAGFETAADAARRFGWKEVTYRAHENSGRGITRAAKDYAKAFGVTPEWLLYGRNKGETANGIAPERVQVLGEVLLGIACKSDSGLAEFVQVIVGSLQGPIEPPAGVPPLVHLRSSLHDKALQFVRQANARTGPQNHS